MASRLGIVGLVSWCLRSGCCTHSRMCAGGFQRINIAVWGNGSFMWPTIEVYGLVVVWVLLHELLLTHFAALILLSKFVYLHIN